MASKPHGRETDISVEDLEYIEESLEIPQTQDDKLKVLLNFFNNTGLTKYIKVLTLQGNSQILAVAHSILNSDYNKIFKKLNIKPDDEEIKHIKSFTGPNEEQMSGKNTMVATVCKIFHMRNFSRDFREIIVSIFNMEYLEDDDDGSQPDENLAASQDYPERSQSRDSNTMKICSCCKFKTQDNVEYKDHMSLHAKCLQCGMYFGDETTISILNKAFHALKPCEKCGKDILEANMKKHLNGHMIHRDFKVVVSKGKVKVRGKEKDELEPKVAKVTGYRLFIKCKGQKLGMRILMLLLRK